MTQERKHQSKRTHESAAPQAAKNSKKSVPVVKGTEARKPKKSVPLHRAVSPKLIEESVGTHIPAETAAPRAFTERPSPVLKSGVKSPPAARSVVGRLIRHRSEAMLSQLAGQILAGASRLVVPADSSGKGTQAQREKMVARFEGIQNASELRRELKSIGKALKAAAPKSATDLRALREFRGKVAQKLLAERRPAFEARISPGVMSATPSSTGEQVSLFGDFGQGGYEEMPSASAKSDKR